MGLNLQDLTLSTSCKCADKNIGNNKSSAWNLHNWFELQSLLMFVVSLLPG